MAFQLPIAQPKYIAVDILRVTQIPKRSTGPRLLNTNGVQTGTLQAIQVQKMAKIKETSSISSTETKGSPSVLSNNIASEIPPTCSSPGSEPVIQTSTYVTFPKYQRTAKPDRHIIKKCAKKVKIYFLNVGNRILSGLEAVGHFYASSERKWQCEYAPLDPLPSQLTALEAIDAADKAIKVERTRKSLRKSPRIKNLRPYGKSVAALSTATLSTIVPSTNNDEELSRKAQAASTIPSISEQLLSRNKNRPQYMRSSHVANYPLSRTTEQNKKSTTKPQQTSRLQLPRQRCFSPPRGRMYPLQRQPKRESNPPSSHDQRADSPTCSSSITQQQQQEKDRYSRHDRPKQGDEVPRKEQLQFKHTNEEKEEKTQEVDELTTATPWSGLEAVAEEQPFFGSTAGIKGEEAENWWSPSRSRHIAEEEAATQRRVDGERAIDCDGFEAGGEFCLRHESCAREAMALGYACLPA